MEAIQPLWEQMPLTAEKAGREQKGGDLFTDIFETAIDAVKETSGEKTQMQYLMATGQLDNPAPLMIALEKAGAATDLLLQLRNKAMDAYSELIRINM